MSKKIFQLAFTCVLVLMSSCSGDRYIAENDTSSHWYPYISAYTKGEISKKSPIRIRFVANLRNCSPVDDEMQNLFSIKPKIKGKVRWVSAREIVFQPDQDLQSGQMYQVRFNLKKLIQQLPRSLQHFGFTFTVIKQNLEVVVNGLHPGSRRDRNHQVLRGTIKTADNARKGDVQKIITVFQDNQPLSIVWDHSASGRVHRFQAEPVIRKESKSTLLVAWEGKAIGVSLSGSRQVMVPAAGQFKVTRVMPVVNKQRYILIRFSDNLQIHQNLTGLIRVADHDVTHVIDANTIRVYCHQGLVGNLKVTVEKGVADSVGRKLKKRISRLVVFDTIHPGVRYVGKGVILPENDKLLIPFEAVNLHSVQVTAFQVYSNNMAQFLQNNNLKGTDNLYRVGRYLWRKTIQLSNEREKNSRWARYMIDASSLLKKYPGSLFRLTLSFNRGNSAYPCPQSNINGKREKPYFNHDDNRKIQRSSWDYAEQYYGYRYDNDWRHRNNPCYDAYYDPRYNKKRVSASRNFISSNIGIIAKRGEDGLLCVATTDLQNAQPLPGTSIKVFNFQNQLLAETLSDRYGLAKIKLNNRPFYIKAWKGNDVGYLKINNDTALPVSHFDVGGQVVNRGVKGYIYGERGVWRPGDTLYLTFVLHDKSGVLPDNHPLHLQLYNPKGQLISQIQPVKRVGDFSVFKIKTTKKTITGNWQAKVLVGGLIFSKTVKIETVVPNRLKIQFDTRCKELFQSQMPQEATISSQWLHGAAAANLKSTVKVTYSSRKTTFKVFKDYIFDDPARDNIKGGQSLFEGLLDDQGNTTFSLNLKVDKASPGMLAAAFETRVFEEGGSFSVDRVILPFHPYSTYVGVKMPKGDEARGMLLTDKNHVVDIVTLDAEGNPVNRKVEVRLYKIRWRWWWDKKGKSLAQYASDSQATPIRRSQVSTKQGIAQWTFTIKYPSWGRYLLRVKDPLSGHASGKIIYIDWPGWAGRAREEKGLAATRLALTADKKSYQVGDTAVIFLPEAKQGNALISVENGSRVISQQWVSMTRDQNKVEIPLTKIMVPNIYIHASLIQPHQDKINDAPIRLYGIIPILVKDPATEIHPVIQTEGEYQPGGQGRIEVAESQGKEMIYTLAVVDEGLLGLTRFRTPDLKRFFYQREALGVKTWDLFDDVVGAYGGELERILAIGGDMSEPEQVRSKRRRFPPMVIFKGPFKLSKGNTNIHRIDIPQYIGAVRLMVVAGSGDAYGSAEQTVPVRKDLMVLSSLPRIIRPEEDLQVPVAVFLMNQKVRGVEVTIDTNEMFEVAGPSSRKIHFERSGDKTVLFRLKSKPYVGKGTISFWASSGRVSAEETVFIDVASANPATTRIQKQVVKGGETEEVLVEPFGLKNTNQLVLELSSVPPLNLEKHLSYLIRYPHGCLEQTLSRAFPQLYLPDLLKLDKKDKNRVEWHIHTAVNKLRRFQTVSGGFSFWPGAYQAHEWVTNYAGHFLLEASHSGYYVPQTMLMNWLDYQKAKANGWAAGNRTSQAVQAFRLYTLALGKLPDLGAMNRMRELGRLSPNAAITLAAAYYLVGQPDASDDLIAKTNWNIKGSYRDHSRTFGSNFRDRAMVLKMMTMMGKGKECRQLANSISRVLADRRWLSTQETAVGLMGMAAYYKRSRDMHFTCKVKIGDSPFTTLRSETPFIKYRVKKFNTDPLAVKIKNTNPSDLSLHIVTRGVPPVGEEVAASNHLKIEVDYYDTHNRPLDIDQLRQGYDFIAEITITNPSRLHHKNLVLSHIVPSGWQIRNLRMTGEANQADFNYQDIRDDRVYTYFDLEPSQSKKVFRVLLNASFRGRFYLPAVNVEAMYDSSIFARSKGKWVSVKK